MDEGLTNAKAKTTWEPPPRAGPRRKRPSSTSLTRKHLEAALKRAEKADRRAAGVRALLERERQQHREAKQRNFIALRQARRDLAAASAEAESRGRVIATLHKHIEKTTADLAAEQQDHGETRAELMRVRARIAEVAREVTP